MPDPTHNPRPLATGAVLATFTVVLGLPMIFSGRISSRAAYDQMLYHEPAIRQFMDQWPHFDFWHYKSATTPGYHLLQAALGRFISPSITAMQLASLAIAAGLMFLLGSTVGRFTRPGMALALCLPFACSMYVVQSGAYLLPDNLGLLGALAILAIALRERVSVGWLVLSGLILLGLVFVRQIHAWTAGIIWLAGWLGPGLTWREGSVLDLRSLFSLLGQRVPRALLALLLTLPSALLLVLFYRFWGGLVPPVFGEVYRGVNFAAVVFMLATFGAFSPFFAAFWLPASRELWLTKRTVLISVLAVVVVVCVVLPTTHDYEAGRRTGLWNIAAKLPTIANHSSPFIIGLATLGALSILSLVSMTEPRRRVILLAAIVGFTAACTTNRDLFQRYFDPFALLLLALFSASTTKPTRPVAQAAGPVFLAFVLLAITLRSFFVDSQSVLDPPPHPREDDQALVPSELPRPPQPPGRHLWPW